MKFMKKAIMLLFLLSFWFSYSQNSAKKTVKKDYVQANNLELIAVKNDSIDSHINYTLKAKNNGLKPIKFVKAVDGSFWQMTAPYIDFVAEVNDNGRWREVKMNEIGRCGNHGDWKMSDAIIEIKTNEEVEIGSFEFWNIDGWFRLLDDATVRLHFKYEIGINPEEKSELKQCGIQPITLLSNTIEVAYKSTRSKKEYDKLKQRYLNYAFSEFVKKNYASDYLLKNLKTIKNTNGEISEILEEALGNKSYKYIGSFMGETKDGFGYRGILYKLNNVTHLGIYAGKHYFLEKKDKNLPLEYIFGDVPYDTDILNNYLYKD